MCPLRDLGVHAETIAGPGAAAYARVVALRDLWRKLTRPWKTDNEPDLRPTKRESSRMYDARYGGSLSSWSEDKPKH